MELQSGAKIATQYVILNTPAVNVLMWIMMSCICDVRYFTHLENFQTQSPWWQQY